MVKCEGVANSYALLAWSISLSEMVLTLIYMPMICRYRALVAQGLPTSSSPPCQLSCLYKLLSARSPLLKTNMVLFSWLQSVLNAATRLIHGSSRYEHITPMLRDLHWLRSSKRIDFKLAVLTYRCLHGLAPLYFPTTSRASSFPTVAVSGRRHPRS